MRAIVLAAGKGTRLHADRMDLPKALFPICGKPILEVVLGLIDFIPREETYIVVGYKKEFRDDSSSSLSRRRCLR